MPEAQRTLAAAGIGVLIGPFDIGLVGVALPAISAAHGDAVAAGQAVVLAYVLALGLAYVPFGLLADHRPTDAILRLGLAIFAIGSLAVAFAPSFALALAGRVIQGVGAAAAVSAGQALAFLVAEPGRGGRNLGFVHLAVAVGALGGPLVGGWLLERVEWQALFAIEPLIALTGIALVGSSRPRGPVAPARGRPDRGLAVGLVLALLAFTAMSANMFLVPYLLQRPLGLQPSAAGAIMTIVPLVILAGAVPSGVLADRVGSRWPVAAGLVLVGLGIVGLALSASTLLAAGVVLALLVYGAGAALFQAPNNRAILLASPGAVGLASGLLGASRQVGQALGVVVSGSLIALAGGLEEPSAYAVAFVVLALVAVLTAALAASRADRPATVMPG